MKLKNILSSRMLKIFAGTFLVRIIGIGSTFFCAVLLARTLGVENFGLYSYVIALVSIFALPVQAGMPTLVLRETAKAKALNDWGRIKGIWLWSGCIVISISLFIYICFIFIKRNFSINIIEIASETVFTLGLIMSLLVAMGNVRGAALRGLGFIVRGQIPEELIKPILLVSLIFISILLNVRLSPTSVMTLNLISAAIAFSIGTWFVYKLKPKELKAEKLIIDMRAWFIAIMPLAMMTGMQSLSGQIDILMLGFLGTISDVGVYKVVVSGAALAMFGLQVINIVISPRIAHAFAKKNYSEVQKIASFGSLMSFLLTLPVVFIFFFAGAQVLEVFFGKDFIIGHRALYIIAIGQAINAFFGSSISILTMSGNEKYVLKGMIISASTNVVLNLILVPELGVDGAALGASISIVIWNIYLWIAIRRKIGIDSTFIWILKR